MRRIRALAALAVVAAASLWLPQLSQATTPVTSLAGFAYFTDQGQWDRLLATPGMRYIVVNSYGAGDVAQINKNIGLAHDRGIRVFGYTPAGYAPTGANGITPKTAEQLQTTIRGLYTTYPGLDGLFLDEILGGSFCDPGFYVALNGWMKSSFGSKTMVLNPGSPLCSAFDAAGDIFLVHENSQSFYNGQFLPYYAGSTFDWLRGLPDSRVWMVAYGVSQAETCSVLQSFATNGAGIVTVDDVAGSSTWNVLPDGAYMANMATCAGTADSGTVVTAAPVTASPITAQPASSTASSSGTVVAVAETTTTTVAATTTTVATTTTAATTVAPSTTTSTAAPTTVPATTTTTQPTAAVAAATAAPAEALEGTPAFTG